MRKRHDEEEKRPLDIWRFVRGVVSALLVSAGIVAVLSIYVLPPPKPPPEQEEVAADSGPVMISGVEVSTQPAYTVPAITSSPDAGPADASPTEEAAVAPEPGTFGSGGAVETSSRQIPAESG